MGNSLNHESERQVKIKRTSGWKRLMSVLFRVVIFLGLFLLILTTALILFTTFIPLWLLIFPFSIIGFGIVLAWIEYLLHKRLLILRRGQGIGQP